MNLLASEIIEHFYMFMWPMIRISAFLLAAPFFSIRAVSVRIRILLAFLLTWMIYPLTDWPLIDPTSAEGLKAVFYQVFVGVLMGILLQIVNAALIIGGQAVSASMGLSMANMVDPSMGNVPEIAQFFVICSTLIFLGLGGHVLVISLLLESFELLPINSALDLQGLLKLTIEWSAMMFVGAILIGLPLMASLLFINIGLGVITRTAPALNIFAVGFPAMILAGIVLLSLSMTSIGYRIQWLWQESFEIIGQALGIR